MFFAKWTPAGRDPRCGALGFKLQLIRWVSCSLLIDPKWTPAGLGVQFAGLALGSWLSSLKAKVHAFSVCDDPDYFYDYVQGLLDGLEAGIDSRDIVNIQNVRVKADYTIFGKAAYGILKDKAENTKKWEGRKILFVHTGGLLGLFDKVEQMAPSLGKNWLRMDVQESVHRSDGIGKMF
ncbi:hypothetical protein L3X38_042176 [Prunus dulcis]|uniref:D-cysteine desulfhydrase n=1 Tax=Prunus dulcis TaxID=3755 RepID=A0AAD4UW26_PRUDU|nr:hypothetical protein L3X38_042176 [Prunus dulcis]